MYFKKHLFTQQTMSQSGLQTVWIPELSFILWVGFKICLMHLFTYFLHCKLITTITFIDCLVPEKVLNVLNK